MDRTTGGRTPWYRRSHRHDLDHLITDNERAAEQWGQTADELVDTVEHRITTAREEPPEPAHDPIPEHETLDITWDRIPELDDTELDINLHTDPLSDRDDLDHATTHHDRSDDRWGHSLDELIDHPEHSGTRAPDADPTPEPPDIDIALRRDLEAPDIDLDVDLDFGP